MRKTAGIILKGYADPKEEFSKSIRKAIRNALRFGIEYRIPVNPENLDKFEEIYHINVECVQAHTYYYFDRILRHFGIQVVLV